MSCDHKNCDCHIVYGGPSRRMEKCPNCDKKHLVYRVGSYDWEPRLCGECAFKEGITSQG